MRVPLSWLVEYVELEPNATPHDVMAELVKVGLEEEGAHGGDIRGPIVVGKVIEFVEEPQANGKTIRWCQVEVAPGVVNGIVCGARNFFEGDKVVVTLPGSALPGGFEIAARKTYGHVSDGMIASSRELGLSDEHEGILRLQTLGLDPEVGTDALELLGLNESAAEVNVTPDRGYCLSIRGIAREYAHASGVKFTDPISRVNPKQAAGFEVVVTDTAPIHGVQGCSRFTTLEVRGIDATAKVPGWMANRLKLAGMRSISIAVDITNYVMLELGQPLHAYDADKLVGGITVRRAQMGERLVTLDEKDRELHPQDLLICDQAGPIGLAGVMGGARTEVSETTKNVLIEAAVFDPISIARSARRHKLPSEASKRFERGVDREVGPYAAARVAQLLIELAGGELSGVGSSYSLNEPPVEIELPFTFASELVGVDYPNQQILDVLHQIGCELRVHDDAVAVTPPSWRPDLRHKTDLVEEVARLVGYDRIPVRIPVAPPGRGLTPRQQLRRRVLNGLSGAGFVEVLNYPFCSSEQNGAFSSVEAVALENPIQSDFPQLRLSLLPGLLSAAARNLSRGASSVALIEEGSVFLPAPAEPVLELPVGNARPSEEVLAALKAAIPVQPRHIAGLMFGDWIPQGPGQQPVQAGFPQALMAVEQVVRAAGLGHEIHQEPVQGLHPGRSARIMVLGTEIGLVGEVDPAIAQEYHLPRRIGVFELNLDALHQLAPSVLQASELRVMPAATQDISLVVSQDVVAGDLAAAISEGAGELLESIQVVDLYVGPGLPQGTKSVTFSLVFRAIDKTLTQAEASASRDAGVAVAAQKYGASLRS
ncbi:phenylalanine--tRNA ligase subunit beta [Aquiluna borgnonia]|uniref:Phenylalanine--tRNA ligase beta subunit n=1 Tax=Aquiluna borgnonia TaxID=2499157 RepID=A0A7D4Q491_9MICO|nr:phenylalanine--tRNA ligase subunit beta [Aquiluna borgnonia]QKJ25429.1 phenylalanine--tRNA ligase subunit beta [Aquiluna borgnonia]